MVQNAISELPETEEENTYNGALFPGVEIPRDNTEAALKKFSRIFPWGNGAPITEKVLFDLLKEEVRSAPENLSWLVYFWSSQERIASTVSRC